MDWASPKVKTRSVMDNQALCEAVTIGPVGYGDLINLIS